MGKPESRHRDCARLRGAAAAMLFTVSYGFAELAMAASTAAAEGPALFGIPVEFILFALTLLGVALFHHHTLRVALTGLAAILAYKFVFVGFRHGAGFDGFPMFSSDGKHLVFASNRNQQKPGDTNIFIADWVD